VEKLAKDLADSATFERVTGQPPETLPVDPPAAKAA
jgi:hypothetical protein